ncbi:MAG: NlpC/P60 family protein [Candidatus Acidiferrum sp.]
MGDERTKMDRLAAGGGTDVLRVWCLSIACACLMTVVPAAAQVATAVRDSDSGARLLSLEEGRSIVNVAWQEDSPKPGMRDCSHLVHQIYVNAGFEYPYASSFEIYAGNANFVRVKYPHAGDLIAWPGHVGIVVDPVQHSFYSLVRTGLESQDYDSRYWKSRGRPRFYRYKVETGGVVSAANAAGSARISNGRTSRTLKTTAEGQNTLADASSGESVRANSATSEAAYGPPPPRLPTITEDAEPAFEIPGSVVVATGREVPTREEVAEGISEVSDAMGSVLRGQNFLPSNAPAEIIEKFSVEKVSVKHDHGWAQLSVDSKVSIDAGAVRVKRRHEKVRWELRRTESGWEAVTPTDRRYIPQDVAIKNLSAKLAQLANSDGATQHQQAVLQQEAQIAGLLNGLLESGRDR